MDSALHGSDRHARAVPEHKASGMTCDRRDREARNIGIIECLYNIQCFGKAAEPGTEHERDLRAEADLRLYIFNAALKLFFDCHFTFSFIWIR